MYSMFVPAFAHPRCTQGNLAFVLKV